MRTIIVSIYMLVTRSVFCAQNPYLLNMTGKGKISFYVENSAHERVKRRYLFDSSCQIFNHIIGLKIIGSNKWFSNTFPYFTRWLKMLIIKCICISIWLTLEKASMFKFIRIIVGWQPIGCGQKFGPKTMH